MKPNRLLFFVLFAASLSVSAQNIASHQWEDRVLIVMTTDSSDAKFARQIQELKANQEGLTDRKLKVYLATPEGYQILSQPETVWIQGDDLYERYNKNYADSEVVLIGLDGQVKHRNYSFTHAKDIFKIIDGMPMRKSEMKNAKNKNKGK